MSQIGSGEDLLSLCKNEIRLAVMDHGWGQKPQAGMAVFLVVPGDEVLTEAAAVLDRSESRGKAWTILHGPELAFRGRVVIGYMRAAVCLGDAEIRQQEGHRF